jgi:hypothetical protein
MDIDWEIHGLTQLHRSLQNGYSWARAWTLALVTGEMSLPGI